MALTLSPGCRPSALTLALVIDATTGVPPDNLISTSLFTAPCSSLATSPASTLRALSFAPSTFLPIMTSDALMMAKAEVFSRSPRLSTLWLVMMETTVSPPWRASTTSALTAPLVTLLTVPASAFRALIFILNPSRHNQDTVRGAAPTDCIPSISERQIGNREPWGKPATQTFIRLQQPADRLMDGGEFLSNSYNRNRDLEHMRAWL